LKRPIYISHILLPLLFLAPAGSAGTKKDYPFKYAVVDMPVSLAPGIVRTPAFPTGKEWYDIMLIVEKPNSIPFHQLKCMVGTLSGPLDWKGCTQDDPLVRADWAVWDEEHVPSETDKQVPPYPQSGTLERRVPNLVAHGKNSSRCACIFAAKWIARQIGSFPAEAGKEYVAIINFASDGSPLSAANPHIIVIKHEDMW
jgi:hypothetical protein